MTTVDRCSKHHGEGHWSALLATAALCASLLPPVAWAGDLGRPEIDPGSGLLGPAGARLVDGRNAALIMQEGSSHQASIVQGGIGNVVAISQAGILNGAAVHQTGADNTVLLLQAGIGNGASVVQSGVRGQALVEQVGNNNFADIRQAGADQYAVVRQYGNDGRAVVIQH